MQRHSPHARPAESVLSAIACALATLVIACGGSGGRTDAVDAGDTNETSDATDAHDGTPTMTDAAASDTRADTTSDTRPGDVTPDTEPDDTVPPVELALDFAFAQRPHGGEPGIVLVVTGVDLNDADVDVATLVLTAGDATPRDAPVGVAYDEDGRHFRASTFVDLGASDTSALDVSVRDRAGHVSNTLSITIRPAGGIGDDCVDAPASCTPGVICDLGEDAPVGTCEAAPGDAPVLSVARWAPISLDDPACSGVNPHLGGIAVAGTSDLPVIALSVLGGTFAIDPGLPPPTFQRLIPMCLGVRDLEAGPLAEVVDLASRISNTVPVTLGPALDAGTACDPRFYGMCGAGQTCDPATTQCAVAPAVDGVDCARPLVIVEDVTRLGDETVVQTFEGAGCLDGSPQTEGADRVYQVTVRAHETLTATLRAPATAMALYLIDTCQRLPDERCLDGGTSDGEGLVTVSYENTSEDEITVWLVVDRLSEIPDGTPAPYELTVARSNAGVVCPADGTCPTATGRKPNVVLVLDYSTSMNTAIDDSGATRWDRLVDGVRTLLTANDGALSRESHLALLRFAHDPSSNAGTLVLNETSGIVDGQALDLLWSAEGATDTYRACYGDELLATLEATVPPMNGSVVGLGTWTQGAMNRARALITASKADHPADGQDRPYTIVVVTDGTWTSMDGTMNLSPSSADPAITAAELYDGEAIPTYVIEISGAAPAKTAADALAAAGGTTASTSDFAAVADALRARFCAAPQ